VDHFGGTSTFSHVPLVLLWDDRRVILVNVGVWDRLVVVQFLHLVEGGMIKPGTARADDLPTRLKASRINLGTRKVPLCLALRVIVEVGLVQLLILKDADRALQLLSLSHLQCIIKRLVSLALCLLIILKMRLDLNSGTLDYVRVLQ
jgi:hypothetical protein